MTESRTALWLAALCMTAAAVSAQPALSDGAEELAGEYRGTVKRTPMTAWAAPVASPLGGQAVALLLFPESERQNLVARLERLTGDQEPLYRLACDGVRGTEYGYEYDAAFTGIWNTRAALVFIHSGPGGPGSLTSGWRTATIRNRMLSNAEYAVLRGREYMVSRITRDPETGELTRIRLTRTGFIQNFFDNPTLSLVPIDTPAGVLELLAGYVKAKDAAMDALQVADQPAPICR